MQLKLGQHLTMTPQLQQAIRLLQLSSLELSVEVQDALDSNMMLELDEDSAAGDSAPDSGVPTDESIAEMTDPDDFDESPDTEVMVSTAEDIPQDLPVDSDWEEIYDGPGPAGSSSAVSSGAHAGFESVRSAEGTLREHLMWQLIPIRWLLLVLQYKGISWQEDVVIFSYWM